MEVKRYRSPADPQHLQVLARRYPDCFKISAAEDRAISGTQLFEVLNYALAECTTWQDADGPTLAIASLNHYDVVKWVVKPSSDKRQCSFVELVARHAQPSEFYVTHYFGQPVRDMLECVQLQLRTRQLGEDTLFWIWAYAHQPDESFVPDVLHASDAFQALKKSSGILLPLGATSVPFSRTWCLLEVMLGVLELQIPLDIVAFALDGPILLTQNLTEVESRMESKFAGTGFRQKNHREQSFPADILVATLDVSLERSDAVSKMDRNRLLHKFLEEAGVEVAAVPLNRQFEKANVKLRGLFASMMWLPIVESDKLPRNTVVECIKANVSQDFLTVNLCASKVDDTHLSLLARCMHKNLTRVDLNFWMCPRLTGKGVEDLARQMPSKLKTLKLNFKLSGVGQGGVDALASFPESLTSLFLNFSYNSEIRSLASICQSIRALAQSSLKLLDLDISGVEKIGDKSMMLLAEALEISRIKNLFLSFRSCRALSDVGVQAIVNALPSSVTLLKMDLGDCEISDASVDALSSQLQHMQHLGVIQVNLHGCQEVTETSISRFVGKLPWTLRGAKLDLSDTCLPKDIQRICRRLTTMRSWMPSKPQSQIKNPTSTNFVQLEPEKVGLELQSVDLFLHRGVVQNVSPLLSKSQGKNFRGWRLYALPLMRK